MDQTLEKAYAARPELRAVRSEEQRAALEARAAADERLPKLSFSGFWLEQGLSPVTIIPAYQYQWSLDVPVFTGGRIQAERAKADLAIRQLEQREQDLRNRIALEVKTAVAPGVARRAATRRAIARRAAGSGAVTGGAAGHRFRWGIGICIAILHIG